MSVAHWTEPGALETHIWRDDQLRLAAKQRLDGTTTYKTYVLDTALLKLTAGGWLSEAVEAAPSQLHFVQAAAIVNSLKTLATRTSVRVLLNNPSAHLSEANVIDVLEAVDTDALARSQSAGSGYAQKTRAFLTRPVIPIRNGTLLCDVDYRTKLQPSPSRANDTLSDRSHPGLHNPELIRPASALAFADTSDLHKKQLAHFSGRIEVLRSSCVSILDSHDQIVRAICDAKNVGISDVPLPPQTKGALRRGTAHQHNRPKGIPPSSQLALAAYMLQQYELHKPSNVRMELSAVTEFAPLISHDTFEERFGILLSEFYLSRVVVIACFVIVMLATGWNKGTVMTLTKHRVQKIPGGYKLAGLKTRSGQNESEDLKQPVPPNRGNENKPTSHTANGLAPPLLKNDEDSEDDGNDVREVLDLSSVRAIDMLLQHRENVDTYGDSTDPSLFVTLALSELRSRHFRLKLNSDELNEFCDFIRHPRFRANDLRKQSHSHFYLANGRDIRATQARANHASATTTMHYIDGTALRTSHEATIKDFGDILSSAFEYSAGRLRFNNNATDRKTKLIKTLLLFPPSSQHPEDGESVADKWIKSLGNISFEIGAAEIKQCAYQRHYYSKNTAKLIAANGERFRHYHLPRILFCEALHRVILDSPLGGQLRSLEATLHEKAIRRNLRRDKSS
ncbi:hypothetical protein [Paraburkholderia sp. HD33-4]|uniref:hypothetical protein n=1 Tax=Paraburkholderia sp. HD33-4 TaxID=2883242 RepID=UPI001F3FBBD9|nr:hypothetical protein [Paraburkholderia sp. HD33-4]